MSYKEVASVSPWQAKHEDCPFNCVNCEYNDGFEPMGKELYVNCKLDNN